MIRALILDRGTVETTAGQEDDIAKGLLIGQMRQIFGAYGDWRGYRRGTADDTE